MKRFPVKLAIMLFLQFACFVTIEKLGDALAEAPYYPFWGVIFPNGTS